MILLVSKTEKKKKKHVSFHAARENSHAFKSNIYIMIISIYTNTSNIYIHFSQFLSPRFISMNFQASIFFF